MQVPPLFDLERLRTRKASTEASSLQVVLQQEAERYNLLLASIGTNCSQLLSALRGIIVFSADLELVASAFAVNKVRLTGQLTGYSQVCHNNSGKLTANPLGCPVMPVLVYMTQKRRDCHPLLECRISARKGVEAANP